MDDPNISIPADVQAMADMQIADGAYASLDDYVSALIREDAKRAAQAKLESLLLEGLEGEATPWTDEDWDALRRRVEEH